jgi:RNA polymerase sigma-70 factor (ECF subfamily)
VGRRYETLCRLSRSLVSGTPEDWFRHLRADLEAFFKFNRLDAVIYRNDGIEFQWHSPGPKQAAGEDVAIREALLGCYQRQQVLWITDRNAKEGLAKADQGLANLDAECGSFCGLPLSTPHRRLGALGLASNQPNPQTTEDLEFLNQVADRFALAIDHWLAHLELQQEKARVKLLLDLTSQVLSNSGIRDVVRKTIMNARSALQSDGAFAELSRRHSKRIQLHVYRILGNWEDVEDVLQDSLLNALMHLDQFRGTCSFSTWLTRIAINSALMLMRKRRVRLEISYNGTPNSTETLETWEFPDSSANPEHLCASRQTEELLLGAIQRLPWCYRTTVELYYAKNCSTRETAQALGISLGATKSRLLRARKTLRASLPELGMSA